MALRFHSIFNTEKNGKDMLQIIDGVLKEKMTMKSVVDSELRLSYI